MFGHSSNRDQSGNQDHKADRRPRKKLITPPRKMMEELPSKIGIKLADGSFYPILEEGTKEKKRLVVTTVRDNQEKICIDLFSSHNNTLAGAHFIGSLLIEEVNFSQKGEPEIRVIESWISQQ